MLPSFSFLFFLLLRVILCAISCFPFPIANFSSSSYSALSISWCRSSSCYAWALAAQESVRYSIRFACTHEYMNWMRQKEDYVVEAPSAAQERACVKLSTTSSFFLASPLISYIICSRYDTAVITQNSSSSPSFWDGLDGNFIIRKVCQFSPPRHIRFFAPPVHILVLLWYQLRFVSGSMSLMRQTFTYTTLL